MNKIYKVPFAVDNVVDFFAPLLRVLSRGCMMQTRVKIEDNLLDKVARMPPQIG